jgi:hypothetical protein
MIWCNHQFLSLHEKTSADAPAAERRYEALWFVGYDGVSERYVMHLLDIFGARYAETLGYGTRDGNTVRFVYEYRVAPGRYLAMAPGGEEQGREVGHICGPEAHARGEAIRRVTVIIAQG